MKMASETLAGGIEKIQLEGRLDIAGCQEIEIKFPAMAASPKKYIVVDLSGVTFLTSIGIRLLLTTARSVKGRGGKLVLFSPDPNVLRVLEIGGINNLIATVGGGFN